MKTLCNCAEKIEKIEDMCEKCRMEYDEYLCEMEEARLQMESDHIDHEVDVELAKKPA